MIERGGDESFHSLILAQLKLENETALPQGGVISPLLANIALHGMEERVKEYADTLPTRGGFGKRDNRKALNLIRYADDFVILAR